MWPFSQDAPAPKEEQSFMELPQRILGRKETQEARDHPIKVT